MRLRTALLGLAFTLTACEDTKPPAKSQDPLGQASDPGSWEIGPVLDTDNSYSRKLPLRPSPCENALHCIDIGPGQDVHYVTFRHGPLTNKQQIRMRFAVEALEPDSYLRGSTLKGDCSGESPTAVTPYFAHKLNNWQEDGTRWWATFASKQLPLAASTEQYEIVAPLKAEANWTSVISYASAAMPLLFQNNLDNADRIGYTFANCSGFGHGAEAYGKVRFKLLEFTIE